MLMPELSMALHSMLKCVKVANARDQSSLLSERWDSVPPPLPPVAQKDGCKANEERMKARLFLMKHTRNLHIILSQQGEE